LPTDHEARGRGRTCGCDSVPAVTVMVHELSQRGLEVLEKRELGDCSGYVSRVGCRDVATGGRWFRGLLSQSVVEPVGVAVAVQDQLELVKQRVCGDAEVRPVGVPVMEGLAEQAVELLFSCRGEGHGFTKHTPQPTLQVGCGHLLSDGIGPTRHGGKDIADRPLPS
jgi:hypothetical protein